MFLILISQWARCGRGLDVRDKLFSQQLSEQEHLDPVSAQIMHLRLRRAPVGFTECIISSTTHRGARDRGGREREEETLRLKERKRHKGGMLHGKKDRELEREAREER